MERSHRYALGLAAIIIVALGIVAAWPSGRSSVEIGGENVEEVVFWHFWGGADRKIVEEVVERFNASQTQYRVRAIAMPGNNLDLKVFLAVTGGDPPDVINQDDPVIGDWAARRALQPLENLASQNELRKLDDWLFPAAKRLGTYDGRLYALCNGLDIRALYYNKTTLDKHGEQPPTTIEELDQLAERITPTGKTRRDQYAFLPDARRLWAWGPVFGGGVFIDEGGQVAIDTPGNEAALKWMMSYRDRYGRDNLAAFRTGDQSLPGKTFPLLSGRYVLLMDGQWRVRDIRAAQRAQRERGEEPTQYGVCPLPPPPGGRKDAGWVNGNFFVVPHGARCPQGAWAFMKFWSGLGHEAEAAETAIAGGWIPVSQNVVDQPDFQAFLQREPLFAEFVRLAGSKNQFPVPVIPGAAMLRREIENVGEQAMYGDTAHDAATLLQQADRLVNERLRRPAGERP
jgi:multiple sugar transport system substrate-binding protein